MEVIFKAIFESYVEESGAPLQPYGSGNQKVPSNCYISKNHSFHLSHLMIWVYFLVQYSLQGLLYNFVLKYGFYKK